MPPIAGPATLDWLLTSDEPAARWVALTQLLDRPPEDPEVKAAHRSVLADPGTRDLVGRLGDWDDPGPLSGHDSPAYAPTGHAEVVLPRLRGVLVRAEEATLALRHGARPRRPALAR